MNFKTKTCVINCLYNYYRLTDNQNKISFEYLIISNINDINQVIA